MRSAAATAAAPLAHKRGSAPPPHRARGALEDANAAGLQRAVQRLHELLLDAVRSVGEREPARHRARRPALHPPRFEPGAGAASSPSRDAAEGPPRAAPGNGAPSRAPRARPPLPLTAPSHRMLGQKTRLRGGGGGEMY